MGGAHKTVNRHNSLICCDGSCIYRFGVITYDQKEKDKLEFD